MFQRWFNDSLEMSDAARTALHDLVFGAGDLVGDERDELLLGLAIGLVDRGLHHRAFRTATASLRKFLKHLHDKFELRYLQGLPEVRSRLHWAADKAGSQGMKLAARCLELCLDSLLEEHGEKLQLPVLRERVARVEALLEDLSGLLEELS